MDQRIVIFLPLSSISASSKARKGVSSRGSTPESVSWLQESGTYNYISSGGTSCLFGKL